LRTAIYTKLPGYEALVEGVVRSRKDHDVLRLTAKKYFDRIAKEKAEAARRAEIAKANAELADAVTRGATIYQSLCFSCHGNDGEGMPVPGNDKARLAPTLRGSPRALGSIERLARIVLQGLMGPVDGKTYPGVMAAMASNDDAWIADVLTFVRNSWGNEASLVTEQEIAKIRSELKRRRMPWTLGQLERFDPVLLARKRWQLKSNRSRGQLKHAVDGKSSSRWTSNRPQQAGTWLTVELPEATELTGIDLETRGSANDFPQSYEVRTSTDGEKWSDPIASGDGKRDDSVIRWAPVTTRFLKVTQTGKKRGLYWSIHELHLFGHGNVLPK